MSINMVFKLDQFYHIYNLKPEIDEYTNIRYTFGININYILPTKFIIYYEITSQIFKITTTEENKFIIKK